MKGYPNQVVFAKQIDINDIADFLPFEIELVVKDSRGRSIPLKDGDWLIRDTLTGAFWSHTNAQFKAIYEEENV